jgi:hypothetical protein
MTRAWGMHARSISLSAALLLMGFTMGSGGVAAAAGGGAGNGADRAAANAGADAAVHVAANAHAVAKADANGGAAATVGSASGTSQAGSHSTSGTAGTSGTPPEPQPLSNADQNAGGANGQCPGGPYCGTDRDQPSMNGNGNGAATGKPCAGCVGKADNKNPKGQLPDASDHNAGYECDTNHGIARGNPAHTACTPPEEGCIPVEGQDENCNPVAPPPCVPTAGQDENCNPVVVPPGSNRPPTVKGVETIRNPGAGVHLQVGPPTALPAAGVLPSTGAQAPLGLLAATGAGLVLLGAATMLAPRVKI